MGASLAEGERERCRVGTTAGPSCSFVGYNWLFLAEHCAGGQPQALRHLPPTQRWWNSSGYSLQGIHFSPGKLVLQFRGRLPGKLGGMLRYCHADRRDPEVKLTIVVVLERSGGIARLELPITAIGRADFLQIVQRDIATPLAPPPRDIRLHLIDVRHDLIPVMS